jgi:hypothetical protein
MDYAHEGSGKVRVVGCAGFSATKNYLTLFRPRQRAWIKRKADLGIVESVVIKRLNTLPPEDGLSNWGSEPEVTYTDTFNRVWLEEELTTQENAVDMARVWWENAAQHARRVLEEGGCMPIRPEGCG